MTGAVEFPLCRQLTRIPDLLVVNSEDPDAAPWFAPVDVVATVEIE